MDTNKEKKISIKSVCLLDKKEGYLSIGDLKKYLRELEDTYTEQDVKYLGKLDDQVLCMLTDKGACNKIIVSFEAEFGLLIRPLEEKA